MGIFTTRAGFDPIRRHMTSQLTSFDVVLCQNYWKNKNKNDILLHQRPQYTDFHRLNPLTKQFFGYFSNSSRFWHNTTLYDVIIGVIWRRFMSKLLGNTHTEILLPQRPQYIDFDRLYQQITNFFGYFYDSDIFWYILT